MSKPIRVKLRFFAVLRELAGRADGELDLPAEARVSDAWAGACERHENLTRFSGSVSFAVNREYVPRDHPLGDGDEVAFIPPVSGG